MRDDDPIESLAAMRHEFGEYGGVNMSIETSTTFTVMRASTLPAIFQGTHGPEGGCYLYGRHFNPTVHALGRQLAALEGAEAAYCTASGMSAISAVLLQLCDCGDRIVASDTIYGGTFALLKEFLPAKSGIDVTFVDTSDPVAVEAALNERTRVLYVETMSNPMLRVADIPRLAAMAHARGARLVVDNTFCPLIVSPIRLGADVVVHSLTKFVNGASDAIAGAVCGSTEFVLSLMDLHKGALMLLGPTMDPRVANEISLRLPHLGLRMAEHGRRALVFASRLRDRGLTVIYPGLPGHPDHELLRRLGHEQYGYGGVFSVDVGSSQKASELMEVLQNRDRFGFMAVSLGYFETLMTSPASTTSSEMSDEELRAARIPPGLVRISVGYTGSLEQRWRQLEDALAIVGLGIRAGQPAGGRQ
ncbi:MAG: aminotransferase class I/II-fold pyridoxal phosphate-dependent enzyme [Acidobacteria bacterium]|nr:aminotransferase class I/II-fold pyridoxal phosphate-dependent enzyme [Acidobacteriota bacterium]